MQPLNPKLINQAKGLARAKMLIRSHLYWLNGYPVIDNKTIFWHCPFSLDVSLKKIIITPAMVSKAHRTINELYRDFPIALPKIVGDAKLWSARCKEYLNYYKIFIKDSESLLNEDLFENNKGYKTKFNKHLLKIKNHKTITHSLSWMHYIDRKPLDKSLQFVQFLGNKTPKNNLTLLHYIQLSHLYSQDGLKSKGIINFILNTADSNAVTEISKNHFQNYLQCKIHKSKKTKSFCKPDKLPATTTKSILGLLSWMMGLKISQRRRVLSMINAIDISTSINKWHIWWGKTNEVCNKIETIFCYADKSKDKTLRTLQKKLRNLQITRPDKFSVLAYIDAIKSFSKSKVITQSLKSLFSSLPKQRAKKDFNYPRKLEFIAYFKMIYAYGDVSENNLANYILELSKHIKENPLRNRSSPWRKLEKYYWGSVESTLFDLLKPEDYKTFFIIINQIMMETKISSYDLDRVIRIIAGKFNSERTVELTIFLLDKKLLSDISAVVMKIAKYYDLDNQEIAKMAKIWSKFDEEYTDEDTLEVMFDTFVEIGVADIFKQLLFAGFANKLRQDCYQIRTIKKIAGNSQVPYFAKIEQIHSEWMNDYPQVFRQSIKELNSVSITAKNKVKKIFLAHWWSKPMIEAQIYAIEKQLKKLEVPQQEKLKPRLDNLQNKLQKHKEITLTEQMRIQNKISEQITLEHYKNWQNLLVNKFNDIWLDFFQLDKEHAPAWFFNDDIVQKLLPIIDFNAKDKQLAIKVIKTRCQTTNWDFRNHPKNMQFINRLKELNIDTQVWITGIKAQKYQAKDASPITLSIEKDPLEVLNMGGYFKTCLSPGSFNYFSVFANIADINKQVIYAKNSKQKVVGRVLVGLTRMGGLMIFHRYCHNSKDNFEELSLEFIKLWAKKAGLTLTKKGDVETIVASNWYDDGAISIDNGIECFKDNSTFRENLSTIDSSLFYDEFKKNLSPLKINGIIFSLLLQLPELSKNNLLFPVLVDIAYKIKYLDMADKITLYKLSHSMGYKNYYEYFKNNVIQYQSKKLKTEKHIDKEVALLMADNNPSDALKLVKKQGRLIAKNWHENLKYNVHEVAIKALNNLGRTQKASEIEKFYKK